MLFLDLVFSSYRVTVQDAQVLSRNKNHPTRFEFDINCKDRIRPYLNKRKRVQTKSFSRSSRAGRERFSQDYIVKRRIALPEITTLPVNPKPLRPHFHPNLNSGGQTSIYGENYKSLFKFLKDFFIFSNLLTDIF